MRGARPRASEAARPVREKHQVRITQHDCQKRYLTDLRLLHVLLFLTIAVALPTHIQMLKC